MSPARRLVIRTPEGIFFSLPLAGPFARMFALMIDAMVISVVEYALWNVIMIGSLVSMDLASAVFAVSMFVLALGYPMVLEWFWRGQTIGKRLFRIRVMDAAGLRLRPGQVIIRNLVRPVDALPGFYMTGGLAMVFSRRAQRLGDMAAGTIVAAMPKIAEPDLDQVLEDKYNSFRAHPHLCARLRQNVTPEQAAAALEALMRREQLEPSARVELFADLADFFRSRVTFDQQATEGLSDERYVRNVVDVLFRT